MRELIAIVTRERIGLGALSLPDYEQRSSPVDNPRVKRSSLGKLTPPDSFMQEELFVSGIVYNVLINLAVLFILHVGYVLLWRERRNPGKTDAPQH